MHDTNLNLSPRLLIHLWIAADWKWHQNKWDEISGRVVLSLTAYINLTNKSMETENFTQVFTPSHLLLSFDWSSRMGEVTMFCKGGWEKFGALAQLQILS